MSDGATGAGVILQGEWVLPAPALDATLFFFVDRLGFRVASVFPADEPRVVVIEGCGLRLRLDRDASGDPGCLRLRCNRPDALAGGMRSLQAPNGTRIELDDADPQLVLPPSRQSLVVTRLEDGVPWHVGRAGLTYRDLLPDRLGGRFIASHIRVEPAGPVADYVHFHKIAFQMIFCRKGWVRVVYEDQGEPFVMHAGDCVLQPPRIRHQVLETSGQMEVVEIVLPALHETFADPLLTLPNPRLWPQRDYGGQRFVRHVAAGHAWRPWREAGFSCQDFGLAGATGGVASARLVRSDSAMPTSVMRHSGDFLFYFVLRGQCRLEADGEQSLGPDDCCAIPAGMAHRLLPMGDGLELLEVASPGD